MKYKKSLYGVIAIILVLSFVSLASGFPSWFDESRLPTPRWTFTPKPTLTIPLTRTITIPTTVPTAVPTSIPTTVPTQPTDNPSRDCTEFTILTWTGDYEFGIPGAKVYILLKGCPPGQYCTESYNYFFAGITDINGKLALDASINSNSFYAVSPTYSNDGKSWHFTGTASKDPDSCKCHVNIRLGEKVFEN